MRRHWRARFATLAALVGLSPSGCLLSHFEVEETPAQGGGAGLGGVAGASLPGAGTAGIGGTAGSISRISQPHLVNDTYVMLQGTSLDRDARSGLLANDTPVNLRVKGFTNLEAGRPRAFDGDLMVIPDGSFHFAPPARFFGNYHFTYTAENLVGQLAMASVDIRVVPTDIDLDAIIQGIGGYVLYGASAEGLGASLDGAHDVNADGRDDLLIGAPLANGGDGAAYVVFGKEDLDSVDVEPLPMGNKEKRFLCVLGEPGEGLGASVAGLGDVDGNGGAEFAFGASVGTGLLHFVFSGDLAASSGFLSPDVGYAIEGDSANIGVGRLLRGGGDVNGDGVPDALFSADNGDYGWLHLPYGDATLGGTLGITEAPGAHVRGAAALDGFPLDAAFVGDLDGDGADEVLAASNAAFYLFRGGMNLPVDAGSLSVNGSRGGYRFVRAAPGAASVSGLGDINGDALPDFAFCDGTAACAVVVTPVSTLAQASLFSGFRRGTKRLLVRGGGDVDGDGLDDMFFADDRSAYLVYGDPAGPQPLDVTALGSVGFAVRAAAGGSITAITFAGDVNHDGLADLAIADSTADAGAGRVYVVFGNRAR